MHATSALVAEQAAAPARVFKHFESPDFCITGSTFSQPCRTGLLRDGWLIQDCGALDAPNYIPAGYTIGDSAPLPDGSLWVGSISSTSREGWQ
jgi:uncharacterized protein (DUF1501 family)